MRAAGDRHRRRPDRRVLPAGGRLADPLRRGPSSRTSGSTRFETAGRPGCSSPTSTHLVRAAARGRRDPTPRRRARRAAAAPRPQALSWDAVAARYARAHRGAGRARPAARTRTSAEPFPLTEDVERARARHARLAQARTGSRELLAEWCTRHDAARPAPASTCWPIPPSTATPEEIEARVARRRRSGPAPTSTRCADINVLIEPVRGPTATSGCIARSMPTCRCTPPAPGTCGSQRCRKFDRAGWPPASWRCCSRAISTSSPKCRSPR